ncbi:MAG TPA: hypothetical protein ENI37_06545 [Chloroflexi bacterium]|nr:hypothetical protein [Chloroflexota bacterium]
MSKRGLLIALGVLALLALTTTAAWAAPLGQDEEVTADALWITLAPLVAIATFIERVLEAFWDRWEQGDIPPRLRQLAAPSAPDYVLKKRLWSHWLGTFIAIIAIGLTNVRLFRLLGFDVLFSSPGLMLFDAGIGGIFDEFTLGTLIDWALTAAIIGWGGTELTHSVIEGLVRGRNLWKEMREVQEGRRSVLDAKFFKDYVAPKLEERDISVTMLRQAFQTLKAVGVSVDEFIGSMTIGKADEFLDQLEAQTGKAGVARAVRTLLEGVPPEKQIEIPNVLNLLTPQQRRRFLGA